MPLPLTNLDDRRWSDLVDEGVALIPRYAPAWTDHNIHDPGRTLIELFAWLTEMTVYRLNRVPPRHRQKFLQLLGFVAEPPRAAKTVFSFSVDANAAPFLLPAGTQFETSAQAGQQVAFSTVRDITLSTANLAAIQVDIGDGNVHDHTPDWRDGLGVAVFGKDPSPGAALYLGFRDLPAQVPVALWLYLKGPGNDRRERRRILVEAEEQRTACREVLPDIQCESETPSTEKPPLWLPLHHSARTVWEVFTGTQGTPWMPLEPVEMTSSPSLGQVVDDTRSITLDGLVELSLSQAMPRTQLGKVNDQLFYIRCRLVKGGYDAPPVLLDIRSNSVLAEQSVPAWQSLPIAPGVQAQGFAPASGKPTRLSISLDDQRRIKSLQFLDSGTGPNVAVLNYKAATLNTPGELTLEMVFLGTGTGRPLAPLPLPSAPVQVESLHLFTHSGSAWQEWSWREDLDSSRRTDFHFVLNPTTGEIVLGDGERGRAPAEQELTFAIYRSTQADLGNIAADVKIIPSDNLHNRSILTPLTSAQQAQLKHLQQEMVEEGAAEEGLEHLTGRAVEKLHAHERLLDLATELKSSTLDQLDQSRVRAIVPSGNGVNLLDIERLALDVPGTRVSRAHACAGLHPDYPCLHAPGVVSVVIVPAAPVAMPQPTPGLIQVVKRFLDRRRAVCTRMEVVGPQYVEVRVTATVKAQSGADRVHVKSAIQRALDAFFDPFAGGPNGRGWPFGRNVYRTEIMQLIADVRGTSHVLSLLLRSGSGEGQCGDLPLCPAFLVASGKHEIEVLK